MAKGPVVAVVLGLSLLVSPGFAGDAEVFDVSKELSEAVRGGRRAVNVSLVKMPDYTVNAVAVKDEIPLHRHDKGSHVLYIISGRGTVTIDGKPVALKPGLVVHIPQGIDHSVKVEGGELRFMDFVRHSSTPTVKDKK
jgi:mannose-6-phosphate isomerase-like protein (cupin superfamily)